MFQVIVAVIAVAISVWWLRIRRKTAEKTQHVDALKNALLTFALNRVQRTDFDDLNMNYASFDGTKLPMLSGYSLNNALFSYMVEPRGMFATKQMQDKSNAIQKYLVAHFDTSEKADAFLSAFIEHSTHPDPAPTTSHILDTKTDVSSCEVSVTNEAKENEQNIEEAVAPF